jgi:hypothetical protein
MWRRSANEPLGLVQVGAVEHSLALRDEPGSLTVVNRGRRQQLQAGMVMLVVIPRKELLAEAAGILDGTEAIRVVGPILHGFEVSLGEWIVVGDVRAALGLHDTEIGQQQSP